MGKLRQKEKKMANEKDAVVVGGSENATMIKSKKKPLAVKINALQEKFGKQKEKIRLWKLNQKKSKEGKSTPINALSKADKAKKRNLKKKQRLARRKAEGVTVYKPRKARKGKKEGAGEEA